MKTPRVKDFDPEAKVPELKSSLADMPSISKPRFRNDQGVQSNPISTTGITKPAETSSEEKNEVKVDDVIRDVHPVRPVLPVPPKRVMKQRWPIDLYQDQYDSLKQLAAEERMQGGVGSMSAMIREALDKLIAERRKK
jgi:hypothetical protein